MLFSRSCGYTALLCYCLWTNPSAQHEHQSVLDRPPSTASALRDTLISNKVIGDVLDDFEPTYYLDLNYPKSHEAVRLGNDIPVQSVSQRPVFTFVPVKPPSTLGMNSTLTLVLTDPDAKSRDNPKWSEMCHWILTNLTSPAADSPGLASKRHAGEVEEYLPPGPPPKTGAHRYVFVLLEGDGSTTVRRPSARKHWGYGKARHGVRDWAKENDLAVVGANFFFAQNRKQ